MKMQNTSVQFEKSPIKEIEPNSFLDGLNIFQEEEKKQEEGNKPQP